MFLQIKSIIYVLFVIALTIIAFSTVFLGYHVMVFLSCVAFTLIVIALAPLIARPIKPSKKTMAESTITESLPLFRDE